MLQIKLFAQARHLAGSPVMEIPWTDGDTVSTLKRTLIERHPALLPVMSKILVAVNNDYARDDVRIRTSDEVACFPPVSGG